MALNAGVRTDWLTLLIRASHTSCTPLCTRGWRRRANMRNSRRGGARMSRGLCCVEWEIWRSNVPCHYSTEKKMRRVMLAGVALYNMEFRSLIYWGPCLSRCCRAEGQYPLDLRGMVCRYWTMVKGLISAQMMWRSSCWCASRSRLQEGRVRCGSGVPMEPVQRLDENQREKIQLFTTTYRNKTCSID